tara:strand:+ start:171815 stop:172015 length:201 start_codon:yes stop_codon:yes gene_type:complete
MEYAHTVGGKIVVLHSRLLGKVVVRIDFRFGNRDGTMNSRGYVMGHFIALTLYRNFRQSRTDMIGI